jgi:hypothetical protein
MKNLLALFIFVCLCQAAFAQGNLQFNQVKLLEPANTVALAFTVPSGKVWKIESTGVGSSSCYMYLENSATNVIAYIWDSGGNYKAVMPVWLPSGYSGFFYLNNCSGQKGMISIIEFNVVP